MSQTILAVPGLSNTTDAFRAALYDMAARNSWDVDAIAAVMSSESGFRASVQNPLPGQTASGLIQFTDSTARALGVPDGAAGIRRMTAEEQLPWVEKFYQRSFGSRRNLRPVDFYLAGWGSGIGQPMEHVLARKSDPLRFNSGKDNLYTLNSGLDKNKNGEITVSDIAAQVANVQASAGGRRISADPLVQNRISTVPAPALAPYSSLPPPLVSHSSSFGGHSGSLATLPTLRVGSQGPAVELFFGTTSHYTANLVNVVTSWQHARKLKEDGIVGAVSWDRFIHEMWERT